MAELDSPSFTFGIQDTMEMGMGNAQLLNDLMGEDTASGNPEDVTPIIKEADVPAPAKKPEVPKGKEIVPTEEGKEPAPQDVIHNFLGDNSDDDAPEEEASANEDNEGVSNQTDDSKETIFTSLSKELFKLGVFTTEEGEEETPIDNPQDFLEKFNAEKKKGAIETVNNFIAQFGEDYQNAFEAIYVKGVNPKDYFGVYNNIVDFTNLDLTDESNQVAVIRQALTDQGFEPEDVTTEVERLKNYGDLESVATKHHKVLVKKEAAKLQIMEKQAEAELQQKANIKNQYIQNVQSVLQEKLKTKEFDGIPLNPKLANELHDFLLVDKWKLPSGELLTDFDNTILNLKKPENHTLKVKVALLLKILEKDPTLSTIQRSAVSKKTDELFGGLARQKTTKGGQAPAATSPKSWFS